MRSLTEQLSAAHRASGLSVGELLAKSGLELERSSLQRKLSGDLRLNIEEAEAIAKVLGVKIVLDTGAAA